MKTITTSKKRVTAAYGEVTIHPPAPMPSPKHYAGGQKKNKHWELLRLYKDLLVGESFTVALSKEDMAGAISMLQYELHKRKIAWGYRTTSNGIRFWRTRWRRQGREVDVTDQPDLPRLFNESEVLSS